MFVISLICNGKLIQTAVRSTSSAAQNLAREWFNQNKNSCPNGFIAIDHQEKGQTKTTRLYEITLGDNEARFYLVGKDEKSFISYRTKEVAHQFLLSFLEFAADFLSSYLKDKRRGDD